MPRKIEMLMPGVELRETVRGTLAAIGPLVSFSSPDPTQIPPGGQTRGGCESLGCKPGLYRGHYSDPRAW
jgi:hypothetical protein